ncbi:MAG: CAP domain-containing protein [Acidobacteria bacterium]|nr:CAP domain-containing protein [Acidobacteriota bacterium]
MPPRGGDDLTPRRRRDRARASIPAALLLLAISLVSGSGGQAAPSSRRGLRLRAPRLERPLTEKTPDPSRPGDPVKAAVLDRINADRARFGIASVGWDEGAARVADAFCARQIQERSRGHFLMDGLPPYARTAFAGIFGLHSENSVSWVTTAPKFLETTIALALSGEEQMMEERPPADGHRVTILDPEATHVGVGYAIAAGRFQMSQEFLTRRMERVTLAALETSSAGVLVSGRPAAGWRLRFVTIAREDPPAPLTREQASGKTSYSYPRASLAYIPEGVRGMQVVGMTTHDKVRLLPGHEFVFPFTPDRPGLYTFEFYVAQGDGSRPRPGGGATIWIVDGGEVER